MEGSNCSFRGIPAGTGRYFSYFWAATALEGRTAAASAPIDNVTINADRSPWMTWRDAVLRDALRSTRGSWSQPAEGGFKESVLDPSFAPFDGRHPASRHPASICRDRSDSGGLSDHAAAWYLDCSPLGSANVTRYVSLFPGLPAFVPSGRSSFFLGTCNPS